jgi:RimJ/RimL family protein N-acetyltransferase
MADEHGIDVELRSPRLVLTPLHPAHADELFPLLDDARLHSFTGGAPLSLDALRTRYARLASRRSPDGTELWLNWVVRRQPDGEPIGVMEATVAGLRAWIAWVIGTEWQRRGYASEAARVLTVWLFEHLRVDEVMANIHPAHTASERVAASVGLTPTDEVADGERVWRLGGEERVRIRSEEAPPDPKPPHRLR